jgi:hypothetical protein
MEYVTSTSNSFIKKDPVLTCVVFSFVFSWGGVLLAIGGPGGIPGTQEDYETLLWLVALALLADPSVAGILLTGLVYGRAGFRELISRLRRWQVGVRWYAVALLIAPALFQAILLPLSLTSSAFCPGILASDDRASLLLMGIVTGGE